MIKPMFNLISVGINIASVKLLSTETFNNQSVVNHPAIAAENSSNDPSFSSITDKEDSKENDKPNTIDKSRFASIDFLENGAQINVTIKPQNYGLIINNLVETSFYPGIQCNYGDGRACTFYFQMPNHIEVTLISAHSGVGGEGEPFRNMIEGTGFNKGLLTEDQVNINTQSLIGSEIIFKQDDLEISGLKLTAIARIPPKYLDEYLSLPIEFTLPYAIEIGVLQPEVLNGKLIVFETCGWQLPDEEYNYNFPNATQSIYLGIIQ